MAVHGISECFEAALLRRMQRPSLIFRATSSRNFVFKLDDWNQLHFGGHILLDISTTSWRFMEFRSVLKPPYYDKSNCCL